MTLMTLMTCHDINVMFEKHVMTSHDMFEKHVMTCHDMFETNNLS